MSHGLRSRLRKAAAPPPHASTTAPLRPSTPAKPTAPEQPPPGGARRVAIVAFTGFVAIGWIALMGLLFRAGILAIVDRETLVPAKGAYAGLTHGEWAIAMGLVYAVMGLAGLAMGILALCGKEKPGMVAMYALVGGFMGYLLLALLHDATTWVRG